MKTSIRHVMGLGAFTLAAAWAGTVSAQPSLSLDGESISSIPIVSPAGPGDVLEATPGVVLPPPLDFPAIAITADLLGIAGPLGDEAGAVFPDLDALSYNRILPRSFTFDLLRTDPTEFNNLVNIYFSVNRAAVGAAGTAIDAETFLFTDANFARVAAEPAADVFTSKLDGTNTHVYDGDGLFAPVPGLGLNEGLIVNPPDQIPAIALSPPTNNLDALDMRAAPPVGTSVFFSVDTAGAAYLSLLPDLDPVLNLGRISPADVLVSNQDGTFSVYATAEQLGLTTLIAAILGDPLTGLGASPERIDRTLNNLDALVVYDDGLLVNGLPFFDPLTDIILFSLDQSSALVQNRDLNIGSLLNPNILAGDVLISGPAGGLPGIFLTAEELGLFVAFQDNLAGQSTRVYSDELDALDVEVIPEPGTMALLGLGGLALLRRRKHQG